MSIHRAIAGLATAVAAVMVAAAAWSAPPAPARPAIDTAVIKTAGLGHRATAAARHAPGPSARGLGAIHRRPALSRIHKAPLAHAGAKQTHAPLAVAPPVLAPHLVVRPPGFGVGPSLHRTQALWLVPNAPYTSRLSLHARLRPHVAGHRTRAGLGHLVGGQDRSRITGQLRLASIKHGVRVHHLAKFAPQLIGVPVIYVRDGEAIPEEPTIPALPYYGAATEPQPSEDCRVTKTCGKLTVRRLQKLPAKTTRPPASPLK